MNIYHGLLVHGILILNAWHLILCRSLANTASNSSSSRSLNFEDLKEGNSFDGSNFKTNINRTDHIFIPHSRFGDDDESDEDYEGLPKINMPLYTKAKTFGQTVEEHKTVHDILHRLNSYMSNQHNIVQINQTSVINNQQLTSPPTIINNTEDDVRLLRDFVRRPKPMEYYRTKKINVKSGRFADSDDFVHSPEERGRHFEGDIVLSQDDAEALYSSTVHGEDRRKKRKFIASPNRRWNPDQAIEYSFDGSHTAKEQKIIELALEHWQNVTCLNFLRRDDTPHGNRIVFTDVDGCASNVGRNPLGEPQFVSLASECLRLGVIAHEVAHALGFWHEQSRPDRDSFVDVVWKNIDSGSLGQFLKEQSDDVDNEGIAYDYGSIMHYRSKAFAKTESLFTIMTNVRSYQKTIGQRDQLSFNDIRLMNKVYCSRKCSTNLSCQRGGYTDPRKCDRCRCPDGFTGKLCEKTMPGYGANCGGEIAMTADYYYFNSPNYPRPFEEGQECSWLLKAIPGEHVELEFVDRFDLYCKLEHSLCMDYVEIRNTSDFANTGMRFCCYSSPQDKIFSSTTDMLVLFRSFYKPGSGFKARARSTRFIQRRSIAEASSGDWEEWSEWSQCTASCGGCGIQVRTRQCADGQACHGENTESKQCNDLPCDMCQDQKLIQTSCGLWGLFRCEKLQSVLVPCSNKCCPGYSLSGSICVKDTKE